MKNIIATVFCLIAFCCSSFYTSAQNVDDIIAKHIEARGGLKNWEGIKSLKMTGRYTGFSMENDYTAIKAKPNLYYADYYLGKHKVIEAFNGKTAWTINPWFDINFPRKCYAMEKDGILWNSEMATPFFNYKEKGYKVALSGKEKQDGIDVYKLELTKKDGKTETWYLDANTYLEYKSLSDGEDFGMPFPKETYYDEFTEVKGLKIPFYIESEFGPRHRVTEIHHVDLNVDLKKNLFNMPLSAEMQKLQVMEGHWNVVVEEMGRGDKWTSVDSTTSKIHFKGESNLLQQDITYESFFPMQKSMSWNYNSDTQKYRLTVFDHFDSNLYVFEGNFEESVLSVDNAAIVFGDPKNQSKRSLKYTLKDLKANHFVIEIARSTDRGENWSPSEQFTYSRVGK